MSRKRNILCYILKKYSPKIEKRKVVSTKIDEMIQICEEMSKVLTCNLFIYQQSHMICNIIS